MQNFQPNQVIPFTFDTKVFTFDTKKTAEHIKNK